MKIKFFSLVMLAIVLFSCSSEETIQLQDENLIETTDEPSTTRMPLTCGPSVCDPDYSFRTVVPGPYTWNYLYIYYNASLTEEEIHCIRQEYFECFSLLRYSLIQTTDIYEDLWLIPNGRPGDEVSGTSCNDPRLNQSCGD